MVINHLLHPGTILQVGARLTLDPPRDNFPNLQVDVVPTPPVVLSEPAKVLLVCWLDGHGARWGRKKPVISRLGGGFNDFLFSSICTWGIDLI